MATGELPLADVVAFWLAQVFIPVSIGIESLRKAPAWRALSEGMEHVSLWEVILFRHIPDVALPSSGVRAGQVA